MKRTSKPHVLAAAPLLLPAQAQAQPSGHGRPGTYLLTGDGGGSKLRGDSAPTQAPRPLTLARRRAARPRGSLGDAARTEWLAGDGTDGRFTARGVTTDAAGRVYVAGGPNGIGTG